MKARVLLFEPGQGWLRWRHHDIKTLYWESNACAWAPEWHRVYPPVRRLASQLHWISRIPRLMLRGHLSWEEVRPDWSSLRADDCRGGDVQ